MIPLVVRSQASVESPATLSQPQLLAAALKPVAAELADLHKVLPHYIPAKTASAKDILHHTFGSGGKHIRPALYLMSCQLVGYTGGHLLPIAAVCEFVHTASLLHDDVVDSSSLRRNRPTANSRWGDESAVLVGDLIYARASEMMAQTGELEIVTTFAAAIRQMSEGELLQLENILHLDLSEQVYYDILSGKTAILMGACCRAAGILGGVSEAARGALEEFGYSLGMAFQLIDDALDYVGYEPLLGKAAFTDLREGKVTLPIILLKGLAAPSELLDLQQILQQAALSDADVAHVVAMVRTYKTAQLTMERARKFTLGALAALSTHFPPSRERQNLEHLAQSLLYRIH